MDKGVKSGMDVSVDVRVGTSVKVAKFIVALVGVVVGSIGTGKLTSVGLVFPHPFRTSNMNKIQIVNLICLNIFFLVM
jgi:hypothetical protein